MGFGRTYGDAGPFFSVGEPFAAEPSRGLVDIREGDEFEGALGAGKFRGLGLRCGCGEDRATEATAVDMMRFSEVFRSPSHARRASAGNVGSESYQMLEVKVRIKSREIQGEKYQVRCSRGPRRGISELWRLPPKYLILGWSTYHFPETLCVWRYSASLSLSLSV